MIPHKMFGRLNIDSLKYRQETMKSGKETPQLVPAIRRVCLGPAVGAITTGPGDTTAAGFGAVIMASLA